jgi:Zn-dependent peptidase ImmA (M78 family)
MTRLYHRLSVVGLPRPYLKEVVFPDWWEDAMADHPAGYAECTLMLARHLGLDLATLQDESRVVSLRDLGPCKFKKTSGTTDDELAMARVIATRSAQMVAAATPQNFTGLPSAALEIRLQILDNIPRWVGLSGLIDYCWSSGVPVVFLAKLPRRAKKMHGMAAQINGRPVIVLCRKVKATAWLLFILAHELGHIVAGHLGGDGVLVDQDVDNNERDTEEDEANAFAIELLTGRPDCAFHTTGRWPNAQNLAEMARAIGTERHIDPGHIVLNYAHTMGSEFWGVANAALKVLEPRANAPGLVRSALAAKLDWSALPEESSEFLMRVTKAEP